MQPRPHTCGPPQQKDRLRATSRFQRAANNKQLLSPFCSHDHASNESEWLLSSPHSLNLQPSTPQAFYTVLHRLKLSADLLLACLAKRASCRTCHTHAQVNQKLGPQRPRHVPVACLSREFRAQETFRMRPAMTVPSSTP